MDFISSFKNKVFESNTHDFDALAIELFNYQAIQNPVYRNYIQYLCLNPQEISTVEEIPFLPIHFFKTHKVVSHQYEIQKVFESSGTTSQTRSRHYVHDLEIYKESLIRTFETFYGSPSEYTFLALLPSYLEREHSSLVLMVSELIKRSESAKSAFFNYEYESLNEALHKAMEQEEKIILIGVSFALLEFSRLYPQELRNVILMETGGMKGRGRELIREDLHGILRANLKVKQIHSEYGMTELLSQAYSKKDGIYETPPWMKVMVRELQDPFTYAGFNENGAINIIDLANIESCAFIETQDIGKLYDNNTFRIDGRMDQSEIRGCNLLF